MTRRLFPLLVFAILLVTGMSGAVAACALDWGETARVAVVVDGDTVRLENGPEVRLVGIQAPKLPLGRPGFAAWPLADEARAALEDLARGRLVRLAYGGERRDRYGRRLAHLHLVGGAREGLWLQAEMVSRGLARVYGFADNRACLAELLAHEARARDAARGLWGDPHYRVRAPEETHGLVGGYQIVEGRIAAAALVKGRAFLNFGPDYRTDFTVTVAPRDVALFEEAGIALDRLAGARVRVRGFVDEWNGPEIVLTHPEAIEVLGQGSGAAHAERGLTDKGGTAAP